MVANQHSWWSWCVDADSGDVGTSTSSSVPAIWQQQLLYHTMKYEYHSATISPVSSASGVTLQPY